MTLVKIGGRTHLKRYFRDWKWKAWLKFFSEFKELYKFYKGLKPDPLYPSRPTTELGFVRQALFISYVRCKWAMVIEI